MERREPVKERGREGGKEGEGMRMSFHAVSFPVPPCLPSCTYPFSKTVESVKDGMQGESMPVLMQVCRGRKGGRGGGQA